MRFANIQVLRLAAAAGVVLYHLGCHAPPLAGVDPAALRLPWVGGWAVPLFFAVSGFVLAGAVRAAPPGRFLVARLLRLYPGYWLALLGTLGLMRLRAYTEYHRWLIRFVTPAEVFLWPAGPDRLPFLFGVEWSLVYEVFLSAALAVLGLAGRRLPLAAGAWLAVILVKVVVRPGYAFDTTPHWSTIGLSAFNAPFLLGVLAYHLKDRGRRWRWAVLAGAAGQQAAGPLLPVSAEWHWVGWGLSSAGVVWLAAQVRQLPDRNPLVRLGDYTYGLFLAHVPLMMAVLYAAARLGLAGRAEVVWAAGLVAAAGGLLFGRAEAAVHARLRPLVRWRPAALAPWWDRVRAGVVRRAAGRNR